jgi:hypothetical protein
MRDYRTYAIRLAVEGGGQVKAELVTVGQSGEQSLKRIESAGGGRASAGLKGLGRQAELLRTGTTRYTYDGAKVVHPPLPSLEELRLLAIERVEHRAEVELQAALGAKLPASVLLFQALSDELTRFQADQEPTAETYPLLASLVGKRGAVDLQRAAQLVAERRARWLQRAAAVEALRLETLEHLEAAQSQEEIDAVLKGLDWGRVQPLSREI